MELSKGIALFVGWLSGALAGIGAILYACGYLLSTAQLHLLGLSGLVNYGQERYVAEGGRFLIDVLGLLGEILLNLLISVGFVALLVLLVLAPLMYVMRRRLRAAQSLWHARLAQLRQSGRARALVFAALLMLLLAGSEDPQSLNAPLQISNLLFVQGQAAAGSLTALLLSGDSVRLKAIFANSLLMLIKAVGLLLLAWRVAAPWRWRPLLSAPFVLIVLLYTVLLPMLYGVLQRQIRLPVISLETATAWPGSDAQKLFLLNQTERDFVLWDAHARRVLWLPVTAVRSAQIRQVEALFAGSAAAPTRGTP
ncbi:hypothetical protein SCT_0796 [Sulfuricella sp. T08]|uniref:hypothetical protein n=1 Tax=Sulfuricella sp. T08 TaxID=1632857 RepID=UPI000617990C|nr:hypothetical protein [Sulfuricella sp. T08]GAO35410.1 hypothetical protein SCT_0796 [Sulfuricella sp. T08]